MSEAQDGGTTTNTAAGTQNTDGTTNGALNSQTQAPAGSQAAGQTEGGADGKDGSGTKPGESDAGGDYAFEMPDGLVVDEARATEFKEIAKELKLPKEAAQKLVDLAIRREQQLIEQHQEQLAEWAGSIGKDPVLSKPENQAIAKSAIDKFGTPQLKEYLASTGLGNHPELVRLAFNVGKAISEDSIVTSKAGGNAAPRSAADVLYGNTN